MTSQYFDAALTTQDDTKQEYMTPSQAQFTDIDDVMAASHQHKNCDCVTDDDRRWEERQLFASARLLPWHVGWRQFSWAMLVLPFCSGVCQGLGTATGLFIVGKIRYWWRAHY